MKALTLSSMRKTKTEFWHNGQIVSYSVCSDRSLEEAKLYYEPFGFEYIGSGKVYFINGFRNESKNLTHFFKKI